MDHRLSVRTTLYIIVECGVNEAKKAIMYSRYKASWSCYQVSRIYCIMNKLDKMSSYWSVYNWNFFLFWLEFLTLMLTEKLPLRWAKAIVISSRAIFVAVTCCSEWINVSVDAVALQHFSIYVQTSVQTLEHFHFHIPCSQLVYILMSFATSCSLSVSNETLHLTSPSFIFRVKMYILR